MFFESADTIQQKTGLLKNEYLFKTFFNYSDLSFWGWFVLPIVLTGLAIWVFPKYILLPAFEKEQDYQTQKGIFKILEERKLETAKTNLTKQTTKKVTAVAEQVKQQKIIEKSDPKIAWGKDFEEFKKLRIFPLFKDVIDSVYSHNGFLQDGSFAVHKEILVYADSSGLVNLFPSKMNLTDKGKYFVKSYSEVQ